MMPRVVTSSVPKSFFTSSKVCSYFATTPVDILASLARVMSSSLNSKRSVPSSSIDIGFSATSQRSVRMSPFAFRSTRSERGVMSKR